MRSWRTHIGCFDALRSQLGQASGIMLVFLLFALLILTAPSVARAAEPATQLAVTKVDSSRFPTIRFAFTSSDSSQQLPAFTVQENGNRVSNVRVYHGQIGQFVSSPRTVIMLAIDASDSMRGAKFTHAVAAAKALMSQARDGDRIGIVTFGATSQVVVAPTENMAELRSELGNITLSRGTALRNGVQDAIAAFPEDATRRIIVLLSDGADTGSTTSEAAVIARARAARVEVQAVGLASSPADRAALTRISMATGGDTTDVRTARQLPAVYATLGRQLLRGLWAEYQSGAAGGTMVTVSIGGTGVAPRSHTYRAPAVQGADGIISVTPPRAAPSPAPLIPLPTGGRGIAIAALPFALLLGLIGANFIRRRSQLPIEARIAPFVPDRSAPPELVARGTPRSLAHTLAPMFRATESILTGSRLWARFRLLLEQSNLPLREVELLYLMIGAGAIGALLGAVVAGSVPGALIGACVGTALPYAWVRKRARKRIKRFEGQLADVLSAVAASLKAGHSFNQSLTAIIRETPDPTAHELNRVMTEARLGLPLEDALEAMATRMGSPDFAFAVTTVNIQRTVGGSLSEILEMVADTVRGRQQFRKKVKALTSMGSMSAYVLLGMPLFMGALLSIMSPDYMAPLWETRTGHVLLTAGAVFMLLGWASCRKIVAIKT
jgi:tight adherence protein B